MVHQASRRRTSLCRTARSLAPGPNLLTLRSSRNRNGALRWHSLSLSPAAGNARCRRADRPRRQRPAVTYPRSPVDGERVYLPVVRRSSAEAVEHIKANPHVSLSITSPVASRPNQTGHSSVRPPGSQRRRPHGAGSTPARSGGQVTLDRAFLKSGVALPAVLRTGAHRLSHAARAFYWPAGTPHDPVVHRASARTA